MKYGPPRPRRRGIGVLASAGVLTLSATGFAWTALVPATAADGLCGEVSLEPVAEGRYNVQNNNYGQHGEQCITADAAGFTVDAAEGEIAPGGAPKSYPSIVAGCHWGRCSDTPGLPVKATDVGDARTGVSITEAEGSWNAAYDIWFNSTPESEGQNDGTELMVWINDNDAPDPIGKPVGQVTLDGASWTVYLGNIGWDVISFVRDEPATTVDLPLEPFVAEAIERGATDPEDWMTSVQFGFEPWSGGEGLAAENFTYQPDGEAPKSSAEIMDELQPDKRENTAGGQTLTNPEVGDEAPAVEDEQEAPAQKPADDGSEAKESAEPERPASAPTSAPAPAAPDTDEATTEPGDSSDAPTTAPSTGEDTRSAGEPEPAAASKDSGEKAAPQPSPARPEATPSATSSTEGEEAQATPTDARQTPTQEEEARQESAAPSAPARTADEPGEDGDAAEKETTSGTQRESAAAEEEAPSAGEDPGENAREGAAPSDEFPVTAPLKPGLPPEPGEASPSSDVDEKKETATSKDSGDRKWWQLWLIAGEDSSAAEQEGPDTGTSEPASTGKDTDDKDSAQPTSPAQTRPTTSPTGAQQKEKEETKEEEEEGTETRSPAPNGDEVSGYEESALADEPVMLLTGETGGEAMADVVDPDREVTAHGQGTPATTPDGGAGVDLDGRSDYLQVDGEDLSIAGTGQLTVEILMRPDKVKDLAATEGSSEGPMVHVLNKGSRFGYDGDQEWATRVYDEDSQRPGRVSNYAFRPEGGEGAGSYDQSGLETGEWVVATAVYDTTTKGKDGWGTVTMYRDGEQVDTDSLGQKYKVTPKDGGAPLFVGGGADDGRFDGAIGAVAVYPTALSDSAIAEHAQAALNADAPAQQGKDENRPAADDASGTAAGKDTGKDAGKEKSRPMPTEAAPATAGKSAGKSPSEDGASS